MQVFSQIVRLITLLVDAYKNYRTKKRSADIAHAPHNEWLRKFGGQDKRSPSSSESEKTDSNT